MSHDTHETIIAALVHKLGGEVTITTHEYRVAADLELTEWDEPAYQRMRITAKKPEPPKTIGEILALHAEWTWSSEYDVVGCEGCDWTKPVMFNEKAADIFREHQAKMIEAEGFTR